MAIFIAKMKFLTYFLPRNVFARTMAFIRSQYGGCRITAKVDFNAVNGSFVCPWIKDWNIHSNNAASDAP